MTTKTYKIDYTDFKEYSKVPIQVRVRMALNMQGMKFEGDGLPSVAMDLTPKPLGKMTWWEEVAHPGIRFFKQELEEDEDGTIT